MNSNELVLNGNDPYFTPVRNVLNSTLPFFFFRSFPGLNNQLIPLPSGPDDSEQVLQEMDTTPVPSSEVTGSRLQGVWKGNWNPRKLPLIPEGFSCFLSRCRREDLFAYLLEMVHFDDPSQLQWIINCKDGYFVVFPKICMARHL